MIEGLIQLSYLPTQHQLADILTKILLSSQFNHLLAKLGVSKPPPSLRGISRLQIKMMLLANVFAQGLLMIKRGFQVSEGCCASKY